MSVNSHLNRLRNAQRAYAASEQACVHWDMEENTGDHECCHDLEEARRELCAAHKAAGDGQ